MDDKILVSSEEYANLNDRLNKLTIEKSHLQMFTHLMNEMNSVSGLENTIQKLLQIILENIGGSNLIIYYKIDHEIHYADVLGKTMKIEQIRDDVVAKVFETKEIIEIKSDFADTKLLSSEFTKASTWAFPLMVGKELIAVLKIEYLYTSTIDLHFNLATFFNYVAHILKNEILDYKKLKTAFNQLSEENNLRKQAEEELKALNNVLEERIVERTNELHQLNIQLEEELTERIQAQEQVLKLNRMYAVLSNINQAIVRNHNAEELLKDICQIAIEQGNFQMAWVGMLNLHTLKVDVVASSGFTGNYLEKIDIDLNIESRSNGPTGIAVKTGVHKISNNIEFDDSMIPWREDAIKYGYKSSASFPLLVFDKVVGAFTIYSNKTHFFQQEDIKLLDELAKDVSFALEYIETETKRKQAEESLHKEIERGNLLLELFEKAPQLSDKQLYDFALDYAVKLTGSMVGFFYLVSDDQKNIILTARKSEVHNKHNANIDSHYPIDEAGNWVDCVRLKKSVIYNDFVNLPNKKGLPEGYGPIYRFMSVPVTDGGKVLIIFGVGNKTTDYNNNDIVHIQLVANELQKIISQRNTEKALRESEEKFRLLHENAGVGIGCYTPEGKVISYNALATKYMQGEPADFVGKSIYEIFPKSDADFYMERINKSLLSETTNEYEDYLNLPSGEKWFFSVFARICDSQQNVIGVQIISQDISARKKTENALKASEEKYRTLIQKIQTAIVVHGGDTQIIACNFKAQELLGLTEDQLLGKISIDPTWHFYREDMTIMPFEEFPVNCVMASRQVLRNYIVGIRRPNNDNDVWCLVNADPVFDKKDHILQVIVTFIDITNRKRIEEKLHQSEERFRRLAENARDVIYRMSLPDGKYEYISPAAHSMFGYSPDEFYANPSLIQQIIHPDWHSYFEEQWTNLLKGEMPPTYEYQFIYRSGEVRWLNQRNILVRDEKGNPKAIEGIVTDITERKHIEAVLLLNESRYRMAQAISHTGNWEYNLQTTHFWGSDEAKRIYGFDLVNDSFTTEEVEKCIPERERVHQALVDLIEQNKPYNLEFVIHPKNSSDSRIITSIAELQRDELGNPLHVVGVIQDITERKRAEEAIETSAKRLNEAQRLAHIGSWELDLKNNNLIWSDEIYRIFEIDPERFGATYDAFLDAIHPDDREAVDFAYTNSLKTRAPYSIDHRLLFSDGRIKYVHEQCETYFYGDKPVRSTGTVQDITERKQMEEALRTTKILLEQTIMQSPVPMVLVSMPDATIRYVNPSAQKYLGIEDEPDPTNTPLTDFKFTFRDFDLQGKEGFLEELPLVRSLTGIKTEGEERYILRKDGTIRYELVTGTPIFDNNGQVIAGYLIMMDITERKLAEEALRESEWRYREIFDNVLDGLYLLEVTNDGKFRTIEVNPALEKLTGVPRSFSVGKTQEETVPTDIAEIVNAKYRHCVEAGLPIEEEALLELPVGRRYFHSILIPARDEAGKIHRIIGISRDITEQKEAEQTLKLLNFALNNVNDEAYLINKESGFDYVNDESCRALGYSREELLQMKVTDIDPDFPFERWLEHWNIIMENGSSVFETTHKTKDGKIYPVEISTNYFEYNGKGYNLALARNISERKQAENEIQKLNQELERRVVERTMQLEAANKELESFSYSVSHDLRAPLRGIDGFSLALIEDYQDKIDDHGKDYLQRVRAATQRMAQLIDDLLNLSRVSRVEINYQEVDLSQIAREITDSLCTAQYQRKVDIIIQDGIKARGDCRLLRIVLENLMDNAWKFTSNHATACIEFGTMQQEGAVTYFVRDDGAGFDMDHAQILFGAFQRLHTVNEFPGTGIGLATVQRIIHRHGGKVWAKGEVEKGATFYFTIAL